MLLSVRHRLSLLTVLVSVMLLSACASGEDFSREDAATALETTGVTTAEASCMADSLRALGHLDAADPRRSRSATDREALVVASTRCVLVSSAPSVAVAGAALTAEPAVDPEPHHEPIRSGNDFAVAGTSNGESRRGAAIARLQLLGRSEANATCIVDQLIEVYADDVFDSPNFGVGANPFEAHAFTLCG